MLEDAKAVMAKWREWFRRNPNAPGTELTVEDWEAVSSYVRSKFSEEDKDILFLFNLFEREFVRGHRCSVCGRTKAQNAEIGYNCFEEC